MRKNVLILLSVFLFVFTMFADKRIELEADLIEINIRSMFPSSKPSSISNVEDYVVATIDGSLVNLNFGELCDTYLSILVYDEAGHIVYQNAMIAGDDELIDLSDCLGGKYNIVINSAARICFRGAFYIIN